ncbi:MAG: sigma-54-dependent Fis family transcriptional regulator [Deltaproteobacteria bacterium]|nr:sigma-54-dependent Fis family transcriptional regulator [Deltaproteobacteria bacterium]
MRTRDTGPITPYGANEKQEALVSLAIELLKLDDYDLMLDAVVRYSLSILRGERGFLVMKRGEGLDFKVIRNWSRDELEGKGDAVSRSIVGNVLRQGVPVLVEDALSDESLGKTESILRKGIRSVLAAPLEVEGQLVGALYLESRSIDRLFGNEQLGLFNRILELSSRALESCMRRILLEQRNSLLERDLLDRYNFPGILTRDPGFLKVLETAAQIAPSDLPVLVQGPTGTGKELIVRAIHLNSTRASRPYVTVNCGAVSPSLLESELFGHLRGAFTGASRDKTGLIPAAHTGTVFLDEVGELPKELQVKLLRTLQFGEIQPVGASRPKTVDVRFIAATNRDLEAEVEAGDFREDLYYRLNAITLELPPLRDRPGDILLLFHHFVRSASEKSGRSIPTVSPHLEQVLQDYYWPGNIRDLENEAKRLVAITPDGIPLSVENLSKRITANSEGQPEALASLDEMERRQIEIHLREAGGNRTQAANTLGLSREGLRKKMKRFKIS